MKMVSITNLNPPTFNSAFAASPSTSVIFKTAFKIFRIFERMKLFGLVLAGLSKAQGGTDFQVVSCNNENTKAPEMTIKVRDLLTVGD